MSGINIQNVLDQLSTLAGAADSTQSVTYLSGLSNAILQANNLTGVIEYPSRRELPTPVDSSLLGKIFYIPPRADYANDPSPRSSDSGGYDSAGGIDTYGAFYYGKEISDLDSGYERIRTTKDAGPTPVGPYSFQGSSFGYTAGGDPTNNVIDKFSFTSDGNASDVGDLTVSRQALGSGNTFTTHGYFSGGQTPSGNSDVIDKVPFSSGGNATDVGNLTVTRRYLSSNSSETNGYSAGGYSSSNSDVIDKVPFSSDGNATDVGNLTVARYSPAEGSDVGGGYGYQHGGSPYNYIDRFAYASDGDATDVGDTVVDARGEGGSSSPTHGYASGGTGPGGTNMNTIRKYPFAASTNSSDVADLTVGRIAPAGLSSTASGYNAGGGTPSTVNTIDKFPFASDANATDVGDMTRTSLASATAND